MTRRKFSQFIGASMVGVSLAVFGTGVVSSPVTAVLPGLKPDGDKTRKYVGPAVESRWIGGESDTYESWAKVWSVMGGKTVRQQLADNIFKQDPLLAYLKSKKNTVLAPSRLADHAGVDVSNFGPKE